MAEHVLLSLDRMHTQVATPVRLWLVGDLDRQMILGKVFASGLGDATMVVDYMFLNGKWELDDGHVVVLAKTAEVPAKYAAKFTVVHIEHTPGRSLQPDRLWIVCRCKDSADAAPLATALQGFPGCVLRVVGLEEQVMANPGTWWLRLQAPQQAPPATGAGGTVANGVGMKSGGVASGAATGKERFLRLWITGNPGRAQDVKDRLSKFIELASVRVDCPADVETVRTHLVGNFVVFGTLPLPDDLRDEFVTLDLANVQPSLRMPPDDDHGVQLMFIGTPGPWVEHIKCHLEENSERNVLVHTTFPDGMDYCDHNIVVLPKSPQQILCVCFLVANLQAQDPPATVVKPRPTDEHLRVWITRPAGAELQRVLQKTKPECMSLIVRELGEVNFVRDRMGNGLKGCVVWSTRPLPDDLKDEFVAIDCKHTPFACGLHPDGDRLRVWFKGDPKKHRPVLDHLSMHLFWDGTMCYESDDGRSVHTGGNRIMLSPHYPPETERANWLIVTLDEQASPATDVLPATVADLVPVAGPATRVTDIKFVDAPLHLWIKSAPERWAVLEPFCVMLKNRIPGCWLTMPRSKFDGSALSGHLIVHAADRDPPAELASQFDVVHLTAFGMQDVLRVAVKSMKPLWAQTLAKYMTLFSPDDPEVCVLSAEPGPAAAPVDALAAQLAASTVVQPEPLPAPKFKFVVVVDSPAALDRPTSTSSMISAAKVKDLFFHLIMTEQGLHPSTFEVAVAGDVPTTSSTYQVIKEL